MIDTTTPMEMSHFHDFYLLQAIQGSVAMEFAQNEELQFSKSADKFASDLDKEVDRMSDTIALRSFMYLWAACLGEARHARSTVARDMYIENGGTGRYFWFEHATDFPPTPENIQTVIDIFDQPWRSGYGGQAWKNIAEALLNYGKKPNAAWIDDIVDIEHNNGTAFSKDDGNRTIMFNVYYPHRFSAFLDYKFQENILTTPPDFTGSLSISHRVMQYLERYCIIFKRQVTHFKDKLDNLGSYVVEWGSEKLVVAKKWAEWVSVGSNSARALLRNSGLYSVYPSSLTRREFKRHLAHIQRRAISKIHEGNEDKIEDVKKHVKKLYKASKAKCKLSNAKTRYAVMPCLVEKGPGNIVFLHFNLPYQKGYGIRTRTGFTVEVQALNVMAGRGYVTKVYNDPKLTVSGKDVWVYSKVMEALLD